MMNKHRAYIYYALVFILALPALIFLSAQIVIDKNAERQYHAQEPAKAYDSFGKVKHFPSLFKSHQSLMNRGTALAQTRTKEGLVGGQELLAAALAKTKAESEPRCQILLNLLLVIEERWYQAGEGAPGEALREKGLEYIRKEPLCFTNEELTNIKELVAVKDRFENPQEGGGSDQDQDQQDQSEGEAQPKDSKEQEVRDRLAEAQQERSKSQQMGEPGDTSKTDFPEKPW